MHKIDGERYQIILHAPSLAGNAFLYAKNKARALEIRLMLQACFHHGRYCEFQDNLKRTKKMMDKFGL